jgi:hypothetical protein
MHPTVQLARPVDQHAVMAAHLIFGGADGPTATASGGHIVLGPTLGPGPLA